MLSSCSVKLCNDLRKGQPKDTSVRYMRLPKIEQLREAWISACGKNASKINVNTGKFRMCILHYCKKKMM